MRFVPRGDCGVLALVEAQHCRSQRRLHDMAGLMITLEAAVRTVSRMTNEPTQASMRPAFTREGKASGAVESEVEVEAVDVRIGVGTKGIPAARRCG